MSQIPLEPRCASLVPAFRKFEAEVIRLMGSDVLAEQLLADILRAVIATYEYTGSGYFVTIKNPSIPVERCTLSAPLVVASCGEIQAGFIIYLGDNELTLECHTWGTVDVPADFRELNVKIQTLPVNFDDSRA